MKKTSLLKCFSVVYEDAKTRISAGGKITRKIKINAVVKQGCPLSPLLFKWVINEWVINRDTEAECRNRC